MPPASLRKTLALVTCLLAGSVLAAESGKWTRRAAAGKAAAPQKDAGAKTVSPRP
ncbi:hypothetical protein [Corallococcus macrosporus]|uniref:hypothetical protein n=1 Tax=Corallococcus macrosporus TaxID=35 RepID=UPI001EFDABCE|nr:hypothetical protein [Corallococcus macrosporus]